jgi:hypothetical protein
MNAELRSSPRAPAALVGAMLLAASCAALGCSSATSPDPPASGAPPASTSAQPEQPLADAAPPGPNVEDVLLLDGTTAAAAAAIVAATPAQDARAAFITWPGNGEKIPGSPAFCFEWGKAAASPASAGEAYFVVFSTPTEPHLVRALTTQQQFDPDEVAWAKLKAAGDSVQLEVLTVVLADGLLANDGGPFSSSPIQFKIAP